MDDLRSLEGVGQLLSQKLNQTNGKIKSKPKHKRAISVPTKSKGDATTSITISTYLPPKLAEALANRINTGFNQVMPANQPNLSKSHSGFTSKDIPKISNNPPQKSYQNGNISNHSNPSVSFADYQNVNSPAESTSPPMSPSAFHKLTLENQHQYAANSNSFSQRAFGHYTAMQESPSWRMGSFRSGNSLHLDLGDIGLLADDGLDRFPPPLDAQDSNNTWHNTSYNSMQPDVEYASIASSPKSNNNVPALRKIYSNNELFTLYSGDEGMSSTDDTGDVLACNTRMNSSIPSDCVPILNQLRNKSFDMDMKLEDFMEYGSEQKDAFNNIGNGASGIVRKAFHFRSCKMVAIKQCRSKQKHEIDAFVKEAKYYEEFAGNDDIVNILGFGKDDNGSFAMAMEYMDLGSCESLGIDELKEDYMSKELIVGYIIFNTLSALVALHEHLYVHNDIKPANILCNRYGEIKLSDFGTVLKLRHKKYLLQKNNGTQRYQSPEKMIFEPIRYNTKTDIWSIGVTTYELLFGDGYAADNELAYVHSAPKLKNKKKYKISAECCDFMTLCFEENYEKRPSAKELVEHEWFKKYINKDVNASLWPWYISMPGTEEKDDIFSAIDGMNGRKRGKGVTFAPNVKHQKQGKKTQLYNEDLLFMISALIIYYSAQFFDANEDNNTDTILHRRRSHVKVDKQNGGKGYSDDERITNMAKYAACSKEIVKDKIRITVNYIKSQIHQL